MFHCLTFKLATFVRLLPLFISTYEAALLSALWLNAGTYLANEKNFSRVPQILHAVFHFLTLPSLAPHHTHFNGKLSTQTVIAGGQRPNNLILHPAVHYARRFDVTRLPCLLISCQWCHILAVHAASPTLPKTVKMSGKDTSKHPVPEETRRRAPTLLTKLSVSH